MSAEMEVSADVQQDQDGVSAEMVNGDFEAEEDADALGELSKDLSLRPIRKARRHLGRQSPGKEVGPEGAAGPAKKTVQPVLAKNSRKSRDGRGRGLPKKGEHVDFVYVVCLHSE